MKYLHVTDLIIRVYAIRHVETWHVTCVDLDVSSEGICLDIALNRLRRKIVDLLHNPDLVISQKPSILKLIYYYAILINNKLNSAAALTKRASKEIIPLIPKERSYEPQ